MLVTIFVFFLKMPQLFAYSLYRNFFISTVCRNNAVKWLNWSKGRLYAL